MSRGAIGNIVNMLVGCGLPRHVAECATEYVAICIHCGAPACKAYLVLSMDNSFISFCDNCENYRFSDHSRDAYGNYRYIIGLIDDLSAIERRTFGEYKC